MSMHPAQDFSIPIQTAQVVNQKIKSPQNQELKMSAEPDWKCPLPSFDNDLRLPSIL